jgi:phenylpropionate dioxygenase-like ring-hydroxylating dioxygenase large terminal subunit
VKLRHPLTGAIYALEPEGLVRVEDRGSVGRFHPDGAWHSGELRDADPHLIAWVGGPQLGAPEPAGPEGEGPFQRPAAPGKPLTFQDLLDRDSRPVPDVLRERSTRDDLPSWVPRERYVSSEVHALEVERIWKRVWQMACREEEIPEVGDTIVYEVADLSLVVVRAADGIRAFHNTCLHRGRQLRHCAGRVRELRCPFHGWSWNLDGTLRSVSCPEEFPDVEGEAFRLPEARIGTWGGFVFVNPDPGAEPLEAFLGDLPRHFERWPLEERVKSVHVAKELECNWKVAQEAFMEAYHVVATHPQLLAGIGDTNSQYDVWGNYSRAITPNGTPSPHLGWQPEEQDVLDAVVGRSIDRDPAMCVPDGTTARRTFAVMARAGLAAVVPGAEELTDAEVSDSFYFTLFPNLHPWGAYNRICYRFRPEGNDPNRSLMEVMVLSPFAGERPPPVPVHRLGPDEDWTRAPELGFLARVFNQDTFNLSKVQRGLRASPEGRVPLARIQESKIRHFHALWEQRVLG